MADWDEDDEDEECPVCHHWQFGCLTCETAPLKQEIEELKADIECLKAGLGEAMIGEPYRPDWVDENEPWLIEVKPEEWIAATDDELRDSIGRAIKQDGLTGIELARAVSTLLAEGKLRRNPKRLEAVRD